MKIFTFLLLSFLFCKGICRGQKLVNAIMVGENGITKDIKQAKFLINIKKINDTAYERLDYILQDYHKISHIQRFAFKNLTWALLRV